MSSSFSQDNMNVVKRDGTIVEIEFDKILKRLKNLGKESDININYTSLVIKIIEQLYDNITTSKIDTLCADYCASLSSTHYHYGILAARILVSNHHKNTSSSFFDTVSALYKNTDIHDLQSPLVTEEFFNVVKTHKDYFESIIEYQRDYLFDYFGFKTLERAYLLKIKGKIVERPQHLWLRVSIALHGNKLDLVKETYDLMSQKYFTHATPTLFNAGSRNANLSSCFLLAMEEDSLDGIFSTLTDCARISKHAGGIGLHIHNIRASGSSIRTTNGISNGIVPMLKVFNDTARFINQSGKRSGSFAIYIEPWHADIFEFLDLKTNIGDEESKARDLFYAIWTNDLFMERVEKNEKWTLMCPDRCPGLADCYGKNFEELYIKYETSGIGNKTINARELWYKILDAQMETGGPYILYKDSINQKSNQKNLGTIKSSNLCTEVVLYTDKNETAVCNLASIGLPTFVNPETKEFDYEKLHQVTKVIVKNLNNVIDVNYYPTEKAKTSNLKHRPIGVGVQGLSDVFFLMDLPFDSPEAKLINIQIFETIYHAALEKSCELAIIDGPYSSFNGSPASQGILQFDMWGVTPNSSLSEKYEWNKLKDNILNYGLRNSMLIAPMPTASTSQILGFNEAFEPITSNIYSRGTLAGEFVVVNKYLMKELIKMGHWNEKIKNSIISKGGSIQHLNFLSPEFRKKYEIVWELSMRTVIDMAADRGAFICQSQSMNLWVEDPSYKNLTSMHFYSWKKGLKTGIYYLRRKAKGSAQQFTVEPENVTSYTEDEEPCEFCSS